ncbi:MAG: DUF4124 domain-containing protein [Deltaproteobacteria bacterium]|nr:DUF4124 domain-containing protein [Deltaproteobacteria bacterium]MBI3387852.1 DUF4124 domain-containing protein [Deltaproteobacteria bacterium]
MKSTVVLLLLTIMAAAARADIVEWRDADGGRHFTNNRDDIPAATETHVVVVEHPKPLDNAGPPEAPASAAEPRRRAQVIYDHSQTPSDASVAYANGLVQGLALARGESGSGSDVQISGPLAIANSYDGASVYPDYAPFVTTGFDRGRSRHQTLRMLLQDQFQLDRDGPFLHERLPIGQGVALHPLLPRGLPRGFARGGRVVTR